LIWFECSVAVACSALSFLRKADLPLRKPVTCDVMAKFYVLNCPLILVVHKGLFRAICLGSRRINYAIYNKERFGLAHNGRA
jgi:hypothetical protein